MTPPHKCTMQLRMPGALSRNNNCPPCPAPTRTFSSVPPRISPYSRHQPPVIIIAKKTCHHRRVGDSYFGSFAGTNGLMSKKTEIKNCNWPRGNWPFGFVICIKKNARHPFGRRSFVAIDMSIRHPHDIARRQLKPCGIGRWHRWSWHQWWFHWTWCPW